MSAANCEVSDRWNSHVRHPGVDRRAVGDVQPQYQGQDRGPRARSARLSTKGEIKKTYVHVPFEPELWRKGEHLPTEQGIVVGCLTKRHRVGNAFRSVRNVLVVKLLRRSHAIPKTADETTALVDTGDVHALMIGAAGVGKTAYWLYTLR